MRHCTWAFVLAMWLGNGMALATPVTQPAGDLLGKARPALEAVQARCKSDAALKPLADGILKLVGEGTLAITVQTPEQWEGFPNKMGPPQQRHGEITIRVFQAVRPEQRMWTPFVPPKGCSLGRSWLEIGDGQAVLVYSLLGDPDAHGRLVEMVKTELAQAGVTLLAPEPAQGGAFDTVKIAAQYVERIKPQLPEGWSVVADKNVVTVSRRKPVEWYGTISLPAHKDKADLKAMGFVHSSPYTITVEFGPPLTPQDVAKMEEQNKRTMEGYYRKHPVDPRAKPTSPPKEITEKLHRIPNVLTKDFSAFVTPSIGGALAFYSPEVEAECQRVEKAVRNALTVKGPARRGALESFKGWELYVWEENGDTLFALMTGTNRLKRPDEIATAAVKGIEAIKLKLDELKEGQSVFIHGRRPQDQAPEKVAEQLRGHCRTIGLKAN